MQRDSAAEGQIRCRAAESNVVRLDPGGGRPDPGCGGGGPWMGSAGSSMGFLFFVFYLIYRDVRLNCLSKVFIYCDVSAEADGSPASVNSFCPPQLSLFQ
jgi:hypothetical protein